MITYAGCPIVWASKLQTDVALSTTEAEYNALSMSLREVIHMMQLIDDSKEMLGWEVNDSKPVVHCKVFEDNSGALEMVRLPKMRPRSKHLCIRLHHFREHVRKGKISINKIPTRYQLGDIATKPQPEDLFVSQRESILQWNAEFATTEELQLPAHHLRACDISEHSATLCEESQQDGASRPKVLPGVVDKSEGITDKCKKNEATNNGKKAVNQLWDANNGRNEDYSDGTETLVETAVDTEMYWTQVLRAVDRKKRQDRLEKEKIPKIEGTKTALKRLPTRKKEKIAEETTLV